MAAGIYLHIPFCKSRCSYCDFATEVYRDAEIVERYVDALCREIEGGNPSCSEGVLNKWDGPHPTGRVSACVDTIYFGGGTPSLLTPEQVERILTAVRKKFSTDPNSEITMEMNPASVTPDSLRSYKALGVNRASFGVQTFNDRALRLLARGHDANDARQTYRMLRDAGFDNVSFDLIAGLPGQTLRDWERNLREAIAMSPEHLSLYLLEVHEGTPLAEQIRSGRQPHPDEDLTAAMYEMMCQRLVAAGYEQYEISNFAKPGFESRHNSKYWRLEPVYGFGVSAHSFDGSQRYANARDTDDYLKQIEGQGRAEVTREPIDAASEFVFLGLRMNDGISLDDYRERFADELTSLYADAIGRHRDTGLIELENGRLRLTAKGMLFSNEVFAEFV